MTKIIIVDDEIMSVKALTIMIEKYIDVDKEIKGETAFDKAIDFIEDYKPDVLLLDIMMGQHTGFDLLARLKNKNFNVIFATAYDNYAIQAIKHSALDYLLKPISAEELKAAFEKHFEQKNKISQLQNEHLLENLNKKPENFTLAIPTLEKTFFISPKDLIRCESESNYTWFYMDDGSKILASKTMKFYESILLEHNFDRIHKSHLVNKSFIAAKGKGDTLILKDNTVLPLSRGKKFDK